MQNPYIGSNFAATTNKTPTVENKTKMNVRSFKQYFFYSAIKNFLFFSSGKILSMVIS